MARVRTAKHPQPQQTEPENESQEVPEQEPETQPEQFTLHQAANDNGRSLNQADLVRQALAAGHEKPADGVVWIKQQFGIDIDSKYYSVAKSQQRKREGGESQPRQPRTHVSSLPTGIPAGFGTDVKEIRALVEKTGGSDELKELIGQLSGLLGKYGANGLGELIEAIG